MSPCTAKEILFEQTALNNIQLWQFYNKEYKQSQVIDFYITLAMISFAPTYYYTWKYCIFLKFAFCIPP